MLDDQVAGGARDGAKTPAPLWVVITLAVFFGGTGLVAGYAAILLTREGDTILAFLLGAFLAAASIVGLFFGIGVTVQQLRLRAALRRGGHR